MSTLVISPPRRGPLGIGVKPAQILLDRHAEDVGDRPAVRGNADRADQGQAGEPRGIAHRQLGRDPAAERGADQMHPIEPQRLQQIEIEIGEIVDPIEPGRIIRLTEAGMLRGEHRETLRQLLEKRHPAGMAAGAVQKHQG